MITSHQGNTFRRAGHSGGETTNYQYFLHEEPVLWGFDSLFIDINLWSNNWVAGELKRDNFHVTSL